MHAKPAAALLLGGLPAAFSFMIVPEIAPADDALFSILPFDVAADVESQTVDLPCAGCPVLLEGQLSTATENHLELTFSVDHAAGFDRLLVNSFELYPNADPFGGSLAAPQIVDVAMKDRRGMMHHHHADEEAAPEVPLGYRIDVYPVAKDEANQKLELINVDLQIIEVGQTFVGSIPTVSLKLVKDGDNLAIAKIETKERTEAPAKPKCTDLWCSVKEMLNKGIGMFKKPCPGMMKHGHHHGAEQPKPAETAPGMSEDMDHVEVPGHRHPHHHHHHGHHGFKEAHGHHRFFGAVSGVIRHVILPVLIGIVAGVSVSLVGMVVISSLLCLVRFVRGKKAAGTGCPFHRRMCRNKAADTEIVIAEEEKSGLMVNQDPPPKYEEDVAPRA